MQVGYQAVTAVSTTLVAALTARGTDVVNKVTTYSFNITINDALSSAGKIRIKFPTDIQLSAIVSTACAQVTGSNLV